VNCWLSRQRHASWTREAERATSGRPWSAGSVEPRTMQRRWTGSCRFRRTHATPAMLKRRVPHHRGRPVQRRGICPCAEVLDTAQGLAVDLASRCAPGPTALRVRTGREQPAVGVAPQLGERVPIAADDFSKILLRRLVAVPAMIGDARWPARPLRAPWRRVAVDPGFVPLGRRGLLSRRRRRDRQRDSTPAWDIHHGARGNLQPAFGTLRAAGAEVPATERLLATLRDERRVMR